MRTTIQNSEGQLVVFQTFPCLSEIGGCNVWLFTGCEPIKDHST